MKLGLSSILRLATALTLLLGALQPTLTSFAQPVQPATAVTGEAYGSVWPGNVQAGYHYSQTFGESGQPYPPDGQNTLLNQPGGLTIDNTGRLFVVERNGARLFGMDTRQAGAPLDHGELLSWAPYGVAGVSGYRDHPTTVMNNPQQVWNDDANDSLWVTNWDYLSIIDKTSGAVLGNISSFDANNQFNENWFSCLQGVAIDPSSSPWQLFVSETCGRDVVLIFTIANPYDNDLRALTLQKVIYLNSEGLNQPQDLQLIDLSSGATDKRLVVASNNGLMELSNDSNDATAWNILYTTTPGWDLRGLAYDSAAENFVYAAGYLNDGPGVAKIDLNDFNNWSVILPGWDNAEQTSNFEDPFDLAFDADGNLFLSDGSLMQVLKFTASAETSRLEFYGETHRPYSTPATPQDGAYFFNTPTGVATDAQDNFYALENRGQRLTKMAPDGTFLWSFGIPGLSGGRESDSLLSWPQGSPAVAASGVVYVPDWNNQRVLLLGSDGAYLGTLGNQPESIYRFDCPAGVAIGPNGDVYVLDQCANNVQVYDSNRIYRSTIGIKWESGSDDQHFDAPTGITVRSENTVLVADRNNQRVQECTRSQPSAQDWSCHTVVGVTGEQTSYHPAYLSNPFAVAWNPSEQQLLVSDQSGVLIYDQEYRLTGQIGNREMSGSQPGMFRNVSGLAVDSSGNLYVADWDAMRVDRFVPALNPLETAGITGGAFAEIGLADVSGQGYLISGMGARLAAFNLIDPPAPAFAGASELLPTNLRSLVVEGDTAYTLTEDDYLRIFSLTDPTNPTQIASLPLINPQSLALAGQRLFTVSCCAGGNAWTGPRLLAFNVSDPANPLVEQIETLSIDGDWAARQMAAYQNPDGSIALYVAMQQAGIYQFHYDPDTTTFAGPLIYQELDGGGQPMVFDHLALNASGETLYVTDFVDWDPSQGRLHALDTASLTDQVIIDPDITYLDTYLGDARMMLAGSGLYLVDGRELHLYNPDDLGAGYTSLPSNDMVMTFGATLETNNVLYSASYGNGLLALSLTPGADEYNRVSLLSHVHAPGGFPGFLAGDDQALFAANWEAGISRFSVADPGRPLETDRAANASFNQVAVATLAGEQYVFGLTSFDKGLDELIVVAGSNPEIELARSSMAYPYAGDPLETRGVFSSDNTNLVVVPGIDQHVTVHVIGVIIDASYGIRSYDVDFSDPVNPVLTHIADTDFGLDSFWNNHTTAVTGQTLLVPNQNSGVKLIDLSDPANLIQVGEISGRPTTVAALGSTAYVFSDDGILRAYDLASPGLDELGSLNWNGPFNKPLQITPVQYGAVTYAYVVNGQQVIVLDVTDPSAMSFVTYEMQRGGWVNSGVNLGNFYLASRSGMGLYSYWAPPQTQATLLPPSGQLDSSAIDGVQYQLDVTGTGLTLLHMPVYQGNLPAPFPTGLIGAGHAYDVRARAAGSDQAINDLGGATYTVSIYYSDADITGINESSLALYYWDGAAWQKEYSSSVDADVNQLTAQPQRFGVWALAGMDDAAAPLGDLVINAGDDYTKDAAVSLTLANLSSDADRVRFKQDCTLCDWGQWQSAAAGPFAFTLSGADGSKTVLAQIVDQANNLSEPQDSITLDTSAPGGSFSVAETSPTHLNPIHLDLSGISDTVSGLDQMMLSEDPDFTGASWQAFAASPAFNLASSDGVHTVYARFSDRAGNVTPVRSAAVTLDQTAPTGALTILGAGDPTGSAEVHLVLTGADNLSGVSKMRTSEDAAFSGVDWVDYTALTAFTLSSGDGAKTVYAQLQDAAGNVSSAAIQDSITLDTTAPAGSVTLSARPYTTSASVNLTLSADSAGDMRVANTSAGLNSAAWQSFAASLPWTLGTPASDGVKNVYVQYKDAANNLSPVYSDTTLLDTTAPAGTLYINGGAALTAAQTVSLFTTLAETGSGVAQMRVGASADLSSVAWTTFANPVNFTLSVGDGAKTVYIQLKDNAGNVSSVFSDTITLDSTAPTGSIVITGNNTTYQTLQVQLTLSASDLVTPTGSIQMQVSNDPGFNGASWQPFAASLAWTLLPGSGEHIVYVRYRDAAGNISTYQASYSAKTYVFLPSIVR